MVTLPQRKVRFYEAVTRLRDDQDRIVSADGLSRSREGKELIRQSRVAPVMLKMVGVLRLLMVRNKDIGIFLPMSPRQRLFPAAFAQCLDFPQRAKSGAGGVFRARIQAGDVPRSRPGQKFVRCWRHWRSAGYRFSIDHDSETGETRELADRGVRFVVNLSAALCCSIQKQTSASESLPTFSACWAASGIDLIAERIEGERAIVSNLSITTCGSARDSCSHPAAAVAA